jgi:hypothetical protein
MAYRNVVRSWLAASMLALLAATPLLTAPTAAAADNVTITVSVRDDGFSQSTIDARVGDYLIFKLDDAAVNSHTLAWDQGQIRFTFSRRPGGTWRRYGPLNAGTVHFYDADQVSGFDAGGPFTGVLTVSDAPPPPPPPPPSSTSSTSTTVTAPPSTATTTTTAPTTTTSAPSTVRPFLIPDPEPTTTTTAVADPTSVGAGPVKNGGATATTANKDKDKGKSKPAAETPTTVAPAPPAAPPESVFDAESLTPGPTTLPDLPSVIDPGDEAALNAASVLSLLDPEKPGDDDNTRLLLIAVGALGLVVVAGGIWCWLQRASRYDPA